MLEKAYGASIRGKYHIKNKIPNQDSFLIDNKKNYTLAVVCDGLGSKKHSKIASKRLCKVIKSEVYKCLKRRALKPYELVVAIQKKYKKRIWPFNFKNSDTTCLFSIISNTSILLFQLGDGLNVLKKQNQLIKCEIEEKDFSNETRSFGHSKKDDWCFKAIRKEPDQVYKILMCTDGIADDIIDDSITQFIDIICDSVDGKKINNSFLKKTLKNWPNKFSNDDKTIVVVK